MLGKSLSRVSTSYRSSVHKKNIYSKPCRGTALRFATRTREFCLSNARSFSYSKTAGVWGYTSSLPCVVMEFYLIKHGDNWNLQYLHFPVVKHWEAIRYSKECRSQWPRGRRPTLGLRALACWDGGFESHRGHRCLSVVSVVCCQVEISATSWSLVQRSSTDCGVSLCVI